MVKYKEIWSILPTTYYLRDTATECIKYLNNKTAENILPLPPRLLNTYCVNIKAAKYILPVNDKVSEYICNIMYLKKSAQFCYSVKQNDHTKNFMLFL